jgi:hypothetical protein
MRASDTDAMQASRSDQAVRTIVTTQSIGSIPPSLELPSSRPLKPLAITTVAPNKSTPASTLVNDAPTTTTTTTKTTTRAETHATVATVTSTKQSTMPNTTTTASASIQIRAISEQELIALPSFLVAQMSLQVS